MQIKKGRPMIGESRVYSYSVALPSHLVEEVKMELGGEVSLSRLVARLLEEWLAGVEEERRNEARVVRNG